MKINISRQSIYLLSLSIFLLIFVFVFAFSFLIPEGKSYRNKKTEVKKENLEYRQYNQFRSEVSEHLSELKSEHRNVIQAFYTDFDDERFKKLHTKYFNSLLISPKIGLSNENIFSVYEVNTTSEIDSPQNFYDFLDAVNKSDWIIEVKFPINFKKEKNILHSSFSMRVYTQEKNTTKVSEEITTP